MNMRSQLFKLIMIRALRMFMITMPVIVLYWQSHGLSIRDIFVLQVIFSIAIVVLEVPTGYFADRYGKKNSMVLGTIFGTLGFFIYYAFPAYAGFVAAEIVLALSLGFVSGTNSAMVYETLLLHGKEKSFKKFQGRLLGIGNVSEAAAAILAGIIAYTISIEAVFLLQWIILALSIPFALSLQRDVIDTSAPQPTLLQILHTAVLRNQRLRYLAIFSGAVSAATLTMVWFTQPHWEQLGINVLYFGYLWAGLNLTVALGSVLAHTLERFIRFRTLFGLIALSPLALFLAMGFFSESLWALAVLPLFWLLRGIKLPIVEDYVHRECSNNERATVLSINALSSRVIFSIFSPFLGWAADIWSLETAFVLSGIVFGSISLIGFMFFWIAQLRSLSTQQVR